MEHLLLHIAETGFAVNQHRETLLLRKDFHGAAECKTLDETLFALFESMKAGFNPNQPRIPAGQSGGGQWVSSPNYIAQQYGWGNPKTLNEHAESKGKKVGATSPRDYAKKAQAFRERAIRQKLPAIEDKFKNIRYYDPKTNLFGAYNKNGTTRTFYPPSAGVRYFENQIKKTRSCTRWKNSP